jgi:hypothetical protein
VSPASSSGALRQRAFAQQIPRFEKSQDFPSLGSCVWRQLEHSSDDYWSAGGLGMMRRRLAPRPGDLGAAAANDHQTAIPTTDERVGPESLLSCRQGLQEPLQRLGTVPWELRVDIDREELHLVRQTVPAACSTGQSASPRQFGRPAALRPIVAAFRNCASPNPLCNETAQAL